MLNFVKRSLYVFLLVSSFFVASFAYAAELNLSPSSGSYKVGDTINVRLLLSSPSQSANAISGTLSFSNDVLTLNSISKSNSLVSLWAVDPSYSNSSGVANLEGIILNGYSGSSGTIVTLVFKAKAMGNANVRFTSSSVLANDGLGTNILTGTGQANFSIGKAEEKVVTPVKEEKKEVVASIQIQELSKKNQITSSTQFMITSVGKKSNSLYKIELDGESVVWEKQDSGLFQTPELKKGNHTLKVSMTSADNEVVTNSTAFIISDILTPVLTEYSDNLKNKDYIVLKGIADPNIEVFVNTKAILSNSEIFTEEKSIKSDDKGMFTYVSEKALSGIYDIYVYSKTKDGLESIKSNSIKITVKTEGSFMDKILNTFSLLIPLIGTMVLLAVSAIWGWYRVLHFREHSRRKLAHAKSTIVKSFEILDDDINEQVKILKKIKMLQPLTPNERTFVNQFKKDIESAEEVITREIKESEK